MKALWVVNKCCGALHQHLYGKKSTGGLWLDAALENAASCPEDQIVVVNIERRPLVHKFTDGNVTYYTLPGARNASYDYRSARALADWKTVIEAEKPDILVLWGTEFPYGLTAMKAAENTPAVIYIQGILDSIAKYYPSGLTGKELRSARTLRDILTRSTIRQTQNEYSRRGRYERQIVRQAGHVIVENHWAESYLRKLFPQVRAHFTPLSICESFSRYHWEEQSMQPHTIMCPAAYYPIKGLHMLLKALRLVKADFPDVKLYIPGQKLRRADTLANKLKQTGYEKLIEAMLRDYGLNDAVCYTGHLTADEMAQKMSSVNCFVMCSSIENHSSSLKEAMRVGAPSIASFVGGVPEYAADNQNCLLYRFEDYEVLAHNICRVFDDAALRAHLSQNAKAAARKCEEGPSDYEKIRAICWDILSR